MELLPTSVVDSLVDPELSFVFPSSVAICVEVNCHPKLLPNGDTVISDVHPAPFCSIHDTSLLHGVFSPILASLLFDGLCLTTCSLIPYSFSG